MAVLAPKADNCRFEGMVCGDHRLLHHQTIKRICQAVAPVAFGLLIEPMGRSVLVVSSGLRLAALVALMLLRQTKTAQAIVHAAE
jgi:hypothetical protein